MKPILILVNLILLLLFAISTSVILGYSLEYNRGNETDRVALLAIKNQLIDNPWGVLRSWNNSQHHCDWEGVTCGHKHQRVTVLDLHSKKLSGTISPSVGNLSFLRLLLLHENCLHGQIPNEIGRLFRLQVLNLNKNTLVGEIPTNLSRCLNLDALDLGRNKLEGNLPTRLGSLTKLRVLRISHNNFTGPLFKVIANFTLLEDIYAYYNAFSGNILDSIIVTMRNLRVLGLGSNELTGVIPSSIFNLSSLFAVELAYNNLQGKLPSNIGYTLPQLGVLNLASNHLSGSFPITLSNMTRLRNFNLQDNSLTNEFPLDFGHLHQLEYLMLTNNQLSGSINFITTLINCTSLVFIGVSGNQFNGLLPNSVANLSKDLQLLGIAGNQISGSIPTGISSLVNLRRLVVSDNQFTGTIPSDLAKLSDIEELHFQNNRLTGSIPNFFANLSHLSLLHLSTNKIRGDMPSSLWSCQNLLRLDLSNNALSGPLSNELFRGLTQLVELNLSYNNLEGSLPSNTGKQINLIKLDVSQNKLTGEIPKGLSNFPALELLFMGGNFFQGSIPPLFSSLQSLQQINLSHNNLSGAFPNYFSTFPLQFLDLSYNNFEGNVSTIGIFANASGVSLTGNGRLCGGIPQLNLCMEKERKKRRLPYPLKLIIPIFCAFVGMAIVAWLYYTCYYKKETRSIPSVFGMKEAFLQVSYNMLRKATDGFSSERLLGAGSFGSVFKGILEPDGHIVAVKVLSLQLRGASKSFMTECKALRNIRHRNLVEIITTCSSIDFQGNDFKALIYKFMSKGNLDKWLHEDGNILSLDQRLDIAIHVACALNYLHHDCEPTIVHCDLKPSNILLDDDMIAHVGDFGLAKFLPQYPNPNQSSSIGIMGTIGYAAPEYGLGGEASHAGDIYSFGILLLELMTGKRPTSNIFRTDFNLHMYAKSALPDQVLHIVDPILTKHDSEDTGEGRPIQATIQHKVECMVAVVKVGVACSNHSPQDRMRIRDALSELQRAQNIISNSRPTHNTRR